MAVISLLAALLCQASGSGRAVLRGAAAALAIAEEQGLVLEKGRGKRSADGYKGVYPNGNRWQARFWQKEKKRDIYVGTHDSAEEAALHLALYKRDMPLDDEKEEEEEVDAAPVEVQSRPAPATQSPWHSDLLPTHPSTVCEVVAEAEDLRLHLSSRSATGYKGVYNARDCFSAQRRTSEGFKYLGTFKTAVEAAVAYAKDAGQYWGPARRRHATAEEYAQVHHHHTITRLLLRCHSHMYVTCMCMLLGRCGNAASVAGAG